MGILGGARCFSYDGCNLAEAKKRWLIPQKILEESRGQYKKLSLLSFDDTPFFRLGKWEIEGSMDVAASAHYHGFYVLEGKGTITFGEKEEAIFPGVQYFVPANAGNYTLYCQEEKLSILCYEGPKMDE